MSWVFYNMVLKNGPNLALEAYSATGKIHLRQQEENQKENAI